MKIYIAAGYGTGKTTLSAYDAALNNAGVANYNLIYLSSIIPPETDIVRKRKILTPVEHFGDRLYAVVAEHRSQEVGKFIAAGIGWYQLEDGRGFFVEHHEIAETKIAVESELETKIHNSLKDMCTLRKVKFSENTLQTMTMVKEVASEPTCVLVIAVYKNENWLD